MNKKLFLLLALSFLFLTTNVFASTWKVPTGYEKISGPSQIKNYTNIIKQPNSVNLYGKKKNNVDSVSKYIDINSIEYYKGILIKGSLDKQYYYVDNTLIKREPSSYYVSALRVVSDKALKLNEFNTEKAVVVDQSVINKLQAKLPLSDTKKEDLFVLNSDNYNICENLFNLEKYTKIEECRGKGFGNDKVDGKICNDNQFSYINGDGSSGLELNGYKAVSDILVNYPRWYANLFKVYEKNGEFYLLHYFGSYTDKDDSRTKSGGSYILNPKNIKADYYDGVFHVALYKANKSIFNCK